MRRRRTVLVISLAIGLGLVFSSCLPGSSATQSAQGNPTEEASISGSTSISIRVTPATVTPAAVLEVVASAAPSNTDATDAVVATALPAANLVESNTQVEDTPSPEAPPPTPTIVPAFSEGDPVVTRNNDATGPIDTTSVTYSLQQIISSAPMPVAITHAADGSDRLFVASQDGRIFVLQNGVLLSKPYLDVSSRVINPMDEQGFLNIVFHPDYAQNGYVFVQYVTPDLITVVERYSVSENDPNVAELNSNKLIISIPQLDGTHNGGGMAFSPFDGYLWLGSGDGGLFHDPENFSQRRDAFQGKILRIDVNADAAYAIPADNPHLTRSDGSFPEVWAMGLRNPWRITFDRARGDLWITDVGELNHEEVNFQEVFKGAEVNYGWALMEGDSCYLGRPCENVAGLSVPLWRYWHEEGRCAIIGGYVYRGQSIPSLTGVYLFGDHCTGEIWGMRFNAAGDAFHRSLLIDSNLRITSFGEDEAGEVYILDLNGGVSRLTSN